MTHLARLLPTALLVCGALAAGCGGSAPARPVTVTPSGYALFGSAARARAVSKAAAEASAGLRPELAPVPARAFARPLARYRRYAGRQADAMAADVTALEQALSGGDRAGARAAWARAYSRYLRIGAAYGALGELDAAIDGTPGGLRRGLEDPRFSGLHRIELGLWRGAPLDTLQPWTARLARDVHTLRRVVRTVRITPLEYATRAHEILEDAQRDMLSGRAAPWSGAGVQATADSLAATEEVLDTLRPLLGGRNDVLPEIDAYAYALRRVLRQVQAAHGDRLPALPALTPIERERIDGALGAMLEALAGIPGTIETQVTPKIPTIASQEDHR